ncbi:MAG: DUF1003 domain-containing protein [Rhodocyclales bacterium]|nr:DUF1003 domain-containing protein [Rhodocyclales bacterium]
MIMTIQHRQNARDRQAARHDEPINLKVELEIHHLLSHPWQRMIEIQELQIDLLNELRSRAKN